MELIREQLIEADLQTVWNALNDDAILQASIPGCESLERTEPDTIRAVVKLKVGPIGARFSGIVKFTDQNPPHGYTITFEGEGGAAGFAKGYSTVNLRSHESGATVLAYEAHAQVGGRLAQIGSRLIDSVASKTAEDFFRAFSNQLAPQPEPAAAVAQPRGRIPLEGKRPQPPVSRPGVPMGMDGASARDMAAIKTSLSVIAGSLVVVAVVAVVNMVSAIL